MDEHKTTIRTRRGIREYTYLGCPLTRNRSAWCFRLCVPDTAGHGRCGRLAPHGLKGRTEVAIEKHNKKLNEAHRTSLEQMYLETFFIDHHDAGVRVAEGEADIVIPVQEQFLLPNGSIRGSICLTLMQEAAVLAVNAIVRDALVVTEGFTGHLTHAPVTGELIARGCLVSISEHQYLAESILTDADRTEIGRGSGTFVKSDMTLSDHLGYT